MNDVEIGVEVRGLTMIGKSEERRTHVTIENNLFFANYTIVMCRKTRSEF